MTKMANMTLALLSFISVTNDITKTDTFVQETWRIHMYLSSQCLPLYKHDVVRYTIRFRFGPG